MCHHADDLIREDWKRAEAVDDEGETDEKPSFASEKRDVDVELLEADDD